MAREHDVQARPYAAGAKESSSRPPEAMVTVTVIVIVIVICGNPRVLVLRDPIEVLRPSQCHQAGSMGKMPIGQLPPHPTGGGLGNYHHHLKTRYSETPGRVGLVKHLYTLHDYRTGVGFSLFYLGLV